MTRASIYITDDAGHGVWLYRGADGWYFGDPPAVPVEAE